MEKEDVGDVLKLIEGITTDSLDVLQEEINSFLDESLEGEESAKENSDINPFLAIAGHYNEKPKDKKISNAKVSTQVKKEDWIEKTHLRPLAEEDAKEDVFDLYDTYKGAHGMESYT